MEEQNAHPEDASAPIEASQGEADVRLPLARAQILLGDPDGQTAGAARATLRRQGASTVVWRRGLQAVEDALNEEDFDLALIDLGLQGGDVLNLVRRVRHGEIGANPFICLIVSCWSPSQNGVKLALEAGADDLVVKPVGALAIATRINRLTKTRKPYVAADGYIGPIRASMKGALAAAAPFEPPNTLKARVTGVPIDPWILASAVDTAQRAASASLVEAAALRFGVAADKLKRAIETPKDASRAFRVETSARELEVAATAAREVVEGSHYVDILPVIDRLTMLADLANSGSREAARAAKLAAEMAQALGHMLRGRPANLQAFNADLIRQIDARFPPNAKPNAKKAL